MSESKEHVKFVVLSQPRTGSTLFCSYMSSHPGVRCLIEPINPATHSHHMQPVDDSICLVPEDIVQNELGTAMDMLLAPEPLPMEWVLSMKAGPTASGFKIMAHQIRALSKEEEFWAYLEQNDIKVVLLFRYNVIMQYVSDLIVKRTRQPTCWDGINILRTARTEVPIDTLEENIRRIVREKKYLIERSQCLHHRRIKYEEFKNNCRPVEDILHWLIGEQYKVRTRLRKQNPDSLRERVTNYDALVKELYRLGFAHLIS